MFSPCSHLSLLFLSFCTRAGADFLRDREVRFSLKQYVHDLRTDAALRVARSIDHSIYGAQNDDDEDDNDDPINEHWREYGEVTTVSQRAVDRAEKRLGLRRIPVGFRWTRLVLEIAIPLIFGIVAIAVSGMYSVSFVGAVFSRLAGS